MSIIIYLWQLLFVHDIPITGGYTDIKPKILLKARRVDMNTLMKKYDNQATQQERIIEANNILN